LKGVVLSNMHAALMSSPESAFNSCSTLLTWDVYRKWRPQATEARLVAVGRITAVILVVFGLLWIPFMKYVSPQLYIYLQSVQAYIAPPIAACFLLGLFFRRLNAAGAPVNPIGLGSDLSGIRAEFPNSSEAVWTAPGGHQVQSWAFTASSADPNEPFSPFEPDASNNVANGTVTVMGEGAPTFPDALLNFIPPAGAIPTDAHASAVAVSQGSTRTGHQRSHYAGTVD